jgi:flagellar M-ring protein FliF
MHRLEGLAQAAVGYDLKRGDAVVVENVGFSSNVTEAPPLGLAKVVEQAKDLAHQEPGMVRAGVMAFLGLLVVLMVLRPVAKQVVTALEAPKALPTTATVKVGLPGATGDLPEGLGTSAEAIAAQETADAAEVQKMIVDEIAGRIQKKPVQSTKLLEQWINGAQETA